MPFCLRPEFAKEFLQKLKTKELDPKELSEMASLDRRAVFASFLGEENAKQVNALFESKLLLKNKKKGMVTWAKQVGGIKPIVRRDLIAKINRMEKILSPEDEAMFLNDLADSRLGISVTEEEAGNIFKMSQDVEAKRGLIKDDSPIRSKERLNYGISYIEFQNYIKDLKLETTKYSLLDYIKDPIEAVVAVAGATKSMLSTLDNSFFGRQGVKMLYTNPDIWVKSFAKSWKDIGMELIGKDAMMPIKADIYSRPNSLNGKYKLGKIDIGIDSEEAFPSSLPEKIPLIGRVFKGAESAFNGAALRMRADYADRMIGRAEKQGIDTTKADQLAGIGHLVNSMTGRGSIGKASALGREINVLMFSIKFLKSNIDTLTAHMLDPKATTFVKKQAAKNLVGIVGSIAAILATAETLHPGSVEWDPRSSDFGKITIGDTRFDVTGGMAGLVVLAARIAIPTKDKKGNWGLYSKSATTDRLSKINESKFGRRTALDIFEDFWEGKLSPVSGLIRDVWKGETYSGDKPTIMNSIARLTTPLSVQNFQQLMNSKNSANIISTVILEALGIGSYTFD